MSEPCPPERDWPICGIALAREHGERMGYVPLTWLPMLETLACESPYHRIGAIVSVCGYPLACDWCLRPIDAVPRESCAGCGAPLSA